VKLIDGAPIRNHPSSMISTLASFIIPVAFMAFIMVTNYRDAMDRELISAVYPIAVLIVLTVLITFRIWQKTTYTFGTNELVVNRDLVMKRVTNIQYSRLSSVNVQRGIINKLFGTTTLLFNVNSSVNTARAEATLTLKEEEADALREELSRLIFKKEIALEQELEVESVVKVSNAEIVLHGLIGQPTVSTLVGIGSLLFSILSLFLNNGGSFIVSVMMIVVSVLPQWIRNIFRYSNYRIYRVGDTVTVQSGLLRNYRISFNVSKINSIRIREPAIARLMGKSILEAEVVGLSDGGIPLLCPLKKKDAVYKAMMALIPEHVFDLESYGQPREAFIPTMVTKLIYSLPFILFSMIATTMWYNQIIGLKEQTVIAFIFALLAFVGVIIPLILVVHGILAQRQRTFGMHGDAFVFVTGGYDKVTEYFLYDKVQTAEVRSGPIQRRFGVSTCTVSILSSTGFKKVSSGLFSSDDLEKVSQETMARILDGRYDYRRYL